MIFKDQVSIRARAGDGGNGMASFRREPYVNRGGPDGGDGGDGGSIILVARENVNTLSNYRHKQHFRAKDGGSGAKANRHGKNGEDLYLKVPLGTAVYTNDELIADITEQGQEFVLAKGGKGGFGNAHFTNSTRQAPNFFEKGEPGDEVEAHFELKMIADVGLVGLPNAGKSTFLSVVSNAKPAIADYPFTTLTPNLGVADVEGSSLLIADIPGLIEGASDGKGLGDDFLRHIERTAVLLHLVDAYANDIVADYKVIQGELKSYKVDLTDRPQIVIITKIDGLDADIVEDQRTKLQKVVKKAPIFTISSVTKRGLDDVLKAAHRAVINYRERAQTDEEDESDVSVVTLAQDAADWSIRLDGDEAVVMGEKIERFAKRTDFENEEAIDRLRHIMRKMGIEKELQRLGVEPEATVRFGESSDMELQF